MLPDAIEAQLAKVLAAESIAAEAAALAGHCACRPRQHARRPLDCDQAVSHAGGVVSAASVNEMLGVAGRDEVGALLDALAARDSARLLAAGDDLAGRALDLAAVLANCSARSTTSPSPRELRTSPAPSLQRFQSAFSAEDLQLYYQIALMGGRDMEFAPDPKVGFDMTLIRMASFEPAGAMRIAPMRARQATWQALWQAPRSVRPNRRRLSRRKSRQLSRCESRQLSWCKSRHL